jgi:hypothetical protein
MQVLKVKSQNFVFILPTSLGFPGLIPVANVIIVKDHHIELAEDFHNNLDSQCLFGIYNLPHKF